MHHTMHVLDAPVNDCRTTRFLGGLTALHLADEAAVQWLGLGAFCIIITRKSISCAIHSPSWPASDNGYLEL